jgi:hypothetical protein
MVFCENKKLNLKLENVFFSKIASLRSTHDDISVKPCDNCNMIMVNYADLWIVHSQVASYHTPFRERGNEASIRVPRMFKSHV